MTPMTSTSATCLRGDIAVPGDKSISHRALIIGGLAVGETRISGLLDAEDVACTATAMTALGASISRRDDAVWTVRGCGVGGLAEPAGVLDMGNSGTAARLLMGVLATHPFTSFIGGDASLCRRPMGRVMTPLMEMGAAFEARSGQRLPAAICGALDPRPITYTLPQPSAQVKSAVLLAGLNTPGHTCVIESRPTRDHTESMLRHFGADIRVVETDVGGRAITLVGQPELTATEIAVPGDISSAAFPLVAALLVPESALTLRRVGVNPLRTGLLETLAEMGADIQRTNSSDVTGEAVADLTVKSSRLRGIDVPAARAPSMIDEYPILAIAAACAEGTTRLAGLGELRVKESDRLAAMATGLAACGVDVEETEDALVVHGAPGVVPGGTPPGGGTIAVDMDHRMAMAFLVLGMVSRDPVRIDDGQSMATSFPGFADMMNRLGARIEEAS